MRSPALGDFTVRGPAEEDTAAVGPVDLVIVAVKAYDNADGDARRCSRCSARGPTVLTLQNGVDSVSELAAALGEAPRARRHDLRRDRARGARASSSRPARTAASSSARCSATLPAPDRSRRATIAATRSSGADIQAEAVGDGRVPIWEKFIFLVSLAGFTGAARLPIGAIWAGPAGAARSS